MAGGAMCAELSRLQEAAVNAICQLSKAVRLLQAYLPPTMEVPPYPLLEEQRQRVNAARAELGRPSRLSKRTWSSTDAGGFRCDGTGLPAVLARFGRQRGQTVAAIAQRPIQQRAHLRDVVASRAFSRMSF